MSYFSERRLQNIYDALTKKKYYEYKMLRICEVNSQELTKLGDNRWKVIAMNEFYVIMEREL